MKKHVGVAVLGLGWMGQAHSRSMLRIPSLFRAIGRSPAGCLRGYRGVPAGPRGRGLRLERSVENWEEAVGADDVGAVWVTAPNMLHIPMIEAATAAGKAVFSEKPIGGKPEQAVRAYQVAQAAGVATGVGYNYLWAPLVIHAKSLIDSGQLGDITHYAALRRCTEAMSWACSRGHGSGGLRSHQRHPQSLGVHGAVPRRSDRRSDGYEEQQHHLSADRSRRRRSLRPRMRMIPGRSRK